jgi:hypothetical protein
MIRDFVMVELEVIRAMQRQKSSSNAELEMLYKVSSFGRGTGTE